VVVVRTRQGETVRYTRDGLDTEPRVTPDDIRQALAKLEANLNAKIDALAEKIERLLRETKGSE
jgi:hypothetical protein